MLEEHEENLLSELELDKLEHFPLPGAALLRDKKWWVNSQI